MTGLKLFENLKAINCFCLEEISLELVCYAAPGFAIKQFWKYSACRQKNSYRVCYRDGVQNL